MTAAAISIKTGQRFGRGVIIDPDIRVARTRDGSPCTARGARLLCDCGNTYEQRLDQLASGRYVSCGCLKRDASRANVHRAASANVTHGLKRHPLYQTWLTIIQRCENPKYRGYRYYGGRGIRVCDRWHSCSLFVSDIERWLGPKPSGMTLDRICNLHDYRLDNVRWATRAVQSQNRGEFVKLTHVLAKEIRDRYADGQVTITALAAEYGVARNTVSAVIRGKSWIPATTLGVTRYGRAKALDLLGLENGHA